MNRDEKSFFFLFLFLAGFVVLYLVNITGWLMHDDEGTDFYEVWQLQQGKQPGVDFIAEQQPLFLLAGSTLVNAFGRSPLPLRLLSVIQVLLAALILAFAVHKVWDGVTAVMTLGLILGSGMVYEQARLFRPDPMMLAWEMIGLGALLLAVKNNRRGLWALAGICYGVGVLFKLFGIFPIVGIAFYFMNLLWRNRPRWREVIVTGLFFAVPFLLVSVGGSALLYGRLGFYYQEAFEYHLNMGQENELSHQLGNAVLAYAYFGLANVVFVFIIPLWILNSLKGWRERSEIRLALAQLVSPIVFVAIMRPLHIRYFLYLTPPLAILLAWQCRLAISKISLERPAFSRFTPLIMLLVIGFAILTTRGSIPALLLSRDAGTPALAEYVASHTQPGDVVLSDYAGINFFANRRSIYEASIIAGAQIEGGIITGQLLIDRLEEEQVEMVLIHVAGGFPAPHQLIKLVDYGDFRLYLNDHFDLLTLFDRTGQRIEVYKRK